MYIYAYLHIYICSYIYIYNYICICVVEYVKLTLQYLKKLICACVYMFLYIISGHIAEDDVRKQKTVCHVITLQNRTLDNIWGHDNK